MGRLAIKVEQLSKAYQLGQIGTGTISRDIERWLTTKILRKDDPFLQIGQTNDRTTKGDSDIVWSLRDLNFEVEQGEVLGVIGRNGAGKSTLLKLLSRVTAPTDGKIKIKGRIASLLEVGTGFHPELTGRENIFLNGAILGMRKQEIAAKFDEIVAFSGVERYIDTPVKRYSSGMYVRLAFAVAAHLESEILIVDEVLAVGDAEFQKKCLGKMGEVSKGEGKTVLFVSHNMDSISNLCNKSLLLKKGQIQQLDYTSAVIDSYYKDILSNTEFSERLEINDKTTDLLAIRSINFRGEVTRKYDYTEDIIIESEYKIRVNDYQPLPNIFLFNSKGDHVLTSSESSNNLIYTIGTYKTTFKIPKESLSPGLYTLTFAISTINPEKIHLKLSDALIFEVFEDVEKRNNGYTKFIPGIVRLNLPWETYKIHE